MLEGSLEQINQHIRSWLAEDVGTGDITTWSTVPAGHLSKAILHVKEAGVICGIPVAERVFHFVDSKVSFRPQVKEGAYLESGTVIAIAEGSTHSILMAERLALNLMQRLSGIATQTKAYLDAIDGISVRLADTRKTTPGHRMLEKYAVRIGGGFNHRFGLYDAVLIKDNHIKASGGILPAIDAARKSIPHTMKIEVEVESMNQVNEAISAKADIIMLDNMNCADMKTAVRHIKAEAPYVTVEASGGVNLQTIKDIALTGVDVISVGGLTSSIQSLDISLDLGEKKEGSL